MLACETMKADHLYLSYASPLKRKQLSGTWSLARYEAASTH
eukprot:COSAG02_NODE_5294_length_4463_cov_7.569432_2_plen_41_part_00